MTHLAHRRNVLLNERFRRGVEGRSSMRFAKGALVSLGTVLLAKVLVAGGVGGARTPQLGLGVTGSSGRFAAVITVDDGLRAVRRESAEGRRGSHPEPDPHTAA